MAGQSDIGGFWNNRSEAFNILNPLIEIAAPSKDALVQLSTIPPCNGSNITSGDSSHIAAAFLQAAAKHMLIASTDVVFRSPEQHGVVKLLIQCVAELAGKAASLCQPRSIISKSGILSTFANLYDRSISTATVEFIQCALLAGQYRYIARIIGEDWPLPGKGISAELVLRYFYLRGIVHIGCDNLQVAIRCFWTVLSIPCDVASIIAVDAWKKMVLAKCIVLQDSVPYKSLVCTPTGASNAVSRFLVSSTSPPESTTLEASSIRVFAYVNMAKAAHAGSRQLFAKVRNDSAELWETDRNKGLVERLARDLEHRRLAQLASVFNILPLSKLAVELGTSEQVAISTLQQVAGLKFRIGNSIAEFEVGSECPMTSEDLAALMKLSEIIRKLDVSITKSSKYQNIKVESGRPPRGVDDF